MKKISFVAFLLFNSLAYSQVISGNVKDSISETLISNAKILITNLNSGFTDSVFTNSSGNWSYDFITGLRDHNNFSPSDF
jgi:hypothetical protein